MSNENFPQLREIAGRVIRPDDAEYDKARTVFLGGVDRRPAVIVRVANADDVARGDVFAEFRKREFDHSITNRRRGGTEEP